MGRVSVFQRPRSRTGLRRRGLRPRTLGQVGLWSTKERAACTSLVHVADRSLLAGRRSTVRLGHGVYWSMKGIARKLRVKAWVWEEW